MKVIKFRSSRSVEALTNFVKYQLSTAINEFGSDNEVEAAIDRTKRNIIARLNKNGQEYANMKVSFKLSLFFIKL